MHRRRFVHVGALSLVHLAWLGCRRDRRDLAIDPAAEDPGAAPGPGFDPERRGPVNDALERIVTLGGLLELPRGFQAVVLQREGDRMSDGHGVAAQPDGMTCFAAPDGTWVLLRNHELGTPPWLIANGIPYDWFEEAQRPRESFAPGVYGGVSRVVLDPNALLRALAGDDAARPIVSSNAVLLGTDRNCAGGPIVHGSTRGWVTCEESDEPGHGWAFLTRIDDAALVPAQERRLASWGRFKREAIAFDPASGVAWMTEDHEHGLFYRHVPRDPGAPFFGAGRLEALRIPGVTQTDPHFEPPPNTVVQPFAVGTRWPVEWVPIEDPAASRELCRDQGFTHGATRFNRVEGITRDADGNVYFIASTAGPLGAGQIFRYTPAEEALVLIAQVDDRSVLSMPDNVTVAPWGDLVMAEDNYDRRGATAQYVRGLRSDGSIYDIARNLHEHLPGEPTDPAATLELPPGAEFAGVCFSPDGKVLFVNLQTPENVTVAITGNWPALARATA